MKREKVQYNELIGKKFGKLIILEAWKNKDNKGNSHGVCLCLCECGNKKEIAYRSLSSGSTKTCALCPKPVGNKHPEWQGYGELSKNLWTDYQHSAKARGYSFNITIEYAWDLFEKQQRKCALTGWNLYFNPSYREKKNKVASLDRIDSTIGYEIGNVQWVHRDVNKLKKNLDNNYFFDLCVAVSEKWTKKKGKITHV